MCTRCDLLQCKRESIPEWQFARYIIQSASAIRFVVVSAAVITPTFQPSLRPLLQGGDQGPEVVSRCQRQYFPSTRGYASYTDTFFSRSPFLPLSPSFSLSPVRSLARSLFRALVDAAGEITHFENACRRAEAVDSSHVWDT